MGLFDGIQNRAVANATQIADQAQRQAAMLASMPPNPMPALARRQLKAAEKTKSRMAKLVELTESNVELTRLAQAASKSTEKFSKRIAIASLAISIASFVVACVAMGAQLSQGGS